MARKKKEPEGESEPPAVPQPEFKGPKAPEWKDIKRLRQQLEEEQREERAVDERMIELVEKTYSVYTPKPLIKDFQPVEYHSGVAGTMIDRYKGFLLVKPVFSIEAGLGPDAQDRAERGEQFINCFPWASEKRRGKWHEPVVEDSCKIGRGFTLVLPMPRWWTEEQGYPAGGGGQAVEDWKKKQLPPILIRHFAGETVKPVMSRNMRVLRAIVVYEEALAEVAERWGKELPELRQKLDEPTSNPAEKVEIVVYVDSHWFIVATTHRSVDGIIGKPFAHGLKVCPLVCFPGKVTSSQKPGLRWKSVLFDAEENIRLTDELISRKATVVRMFPIPQPWVRVKEDSPAEEGRPKDLTLDPRKPLMLWENEETGYLYPQGQLPEAESLEARLREDRQVSLLPDLSAGLDVGSTSPAWTVRQRAELMTRGTLVPIATNLASGAELLAELVFRCIMSPWINEKVYVKPEGGPGTQPVGIGPEEAEGFLDRISARITVQGPIDRNQDFALARMAWTDLDLPWDFAIQELAHLENPGALRKAKLLEKVLASDEYQAKLMADALAEADMAERQEAMMQPEELMGAMQGWPPAAQQAVMGIPGGEGAGGRYPEGASPVGLAPPMPGDIRGPSPMAPMPGGAEVPPLP